MKGDGSGSKFDVKVRKSGAPASSPAGAQASGACVGNGGEDAAWPAAETAAFRGGSF
jgi:hypothetical protein